jgi:hypothetical protein
MPSLPFCFRFNRLAANWLRQATRLRRTGQKRLDPLDFEPPEFRGAGPLLHPFRVSGELGGDFHPPVLVLTGHPQRGLKRLDLLIP